MDGTEDESRSERRARWTPALLLGGMVALWAIATGGHSYLHCDARRNARQASCVSNMKSIAAHTLEYLADHGGRFPPPPATPAKQVPGSTDLTSAFPPDDWHRLFAPYMVDTLIYICPSTRSICSYELNPRLYGVSLKKIQNPARVLLQYETGFLTGTPPGPHDHGYNVTFVDGHAKLMRGPLSQVEGVTVSPGD